MTVRGEGWRRRGHGGKVAVRSLVRVSWGLLCSVNEGVIVQPAFSMSYIPPENPSYHYLVRYRRLMIIK